MNKLYFILFLFAFAACGRSANKAYNRGDYNETIDRAVKRLQKRPDDGEMVYLAKTAYKEASAQHSERIRNLSSGTRYEEVFHEYQQLQNLYSRIQQSPVLMNAIKPVNYQSHLDTWGEKAAQKFADEASDAMSGGRKDDYREAYKLFQRAAYFRPDDRNLQQKMREAFEGGMIQVVVLDNNRFSRFTGFSNPALQNFDRQLVRNLRNRVNNEFVLFWDEMDFRGRNMQPDEFLDLQWGRFFLAQPIEDNDVRTVEKKIVVKETVFKADSVVKEYATVKAEIVTNRRVFNAEGEMFLTATDNRNQILFTDVVRGNYRWQSSIVYYRGDERALSESDRKSLTSATHPTPPEDAIMNGIAGEVFGQLSNRLRSHYNWR